jgi:hypothetical protein
VRRALGAALVGLALFAPAARAQDPGVTIDQDSPSAKEYEIPLESARRAAVPGADASAPVVPGERGAAPLFGAGVTPTAKGRGGTSRPEPKRAGRRAADPVRAPAVVQAAASNPGAPRGGAGTTALIGVSGALVLALGAGAGVLLRRRAASRT